MNQSTRHEKPLSKTKTHGNNPNQITINQHVIPNKHILEWSADGKMVNVNDIATNAKKTIPASNAYFCAMRLWDQWTESKMLKSNEDNFQKQMAFLRKGLPLTDHTHITTYYIMLCARIYFSNKGRPHKESLFYDISYDPSKAELEKNELEMEGPIHIVKSTIDPNSQHMDRQAIKMMMSQTFIQWCEAINIKDRKWVIYHSNDTKLILSDAFYGNYSKGLHIIPINPKQALIEDSTYKVLNEQNLLSSEFINKIFTTEAVKYYITAE